MTIHLEDEFDRVFHEILAIHQKNRGRTSFELLKVTDADRFTAGATPGERQFLGLLPAHEIRVVYFRGWFGDDKPEEGVLWVRLGAGRARVIGFGRGQPNGI
jgi:hypothetical protein